MSYYLASLKEINSMLNFKVNAQKSLKRSHETDLGDLHLLYKPCKWERKQVVNSIGIVGIRGETEETEEDRQFVDYCVDRLAKRHQTLKHSPIVSFYDVDMEKYPDFSSLHEQSTMYVVGHGGVNENGYATLANKEADHIAEILFEDCHLPKTEAIHFVSCDLGATAFLPDFKSVLKKEKYVPEHALPLLFGYTREVTMSIDGTLWVDNGEELGFETAENYKLVL